MNPLIQALMNRINLARSPQPDLEAQLGPVTPAMMPMLPGKRLLGGLGKLKDATVDLMGSWQPPTQVMPSASDTDALTGALKYSLAKVPNAAKLTPAVSQASSLTDFLNPNVQNKMQQMYDAARPTVQRMQAAGQFGGDRAVVGIPPNSSSKLLELLQQGNR